MSVSFAFFFFLIFAIVVIGIIVAIIWAIVSGVSRRYVNATTQLGSDGFWITSCPAQPMSMIHYIYLVDGIRRSGQVAYQPGPDGRQFIYTGGTPVQVSIVQIAEPYDGDPVVVMPPPIIEVSSSDWTTHSSPSHSSSFPSAY